jgi:type IV secretion system protein VirB9
MISTFATAKAASPLPLARREHGTAPPTQAKDQPASPAVPNEVSQATLPEPKVVAIPVPLPPQANLKQFPQRTPPHAAGRSRRSRVAPLSRTGWERQWRLRGFSERTGFINAIQVFPTPRARSTRFMPSPAR